MAPSLGNQLALLMAASAFLGSTRAQFGPSTNPASGLVSLSNSTGASCGIDTLQAATFLGQATSSINVAMEKCSHHSSGSEFGVDCGIPVSQVIKSILFIASFLAGAAEECAEAMNLDSVFKELGLDGVFADKNHRAECAKAVTGFLAGLGQIATEAMKLTQSCNFMNKVGSSDFPPAPASYPRRMTQYGGEDPTQYGGGDPLEAVEQLGENTMKSVAHAANDVEAQCTLDATGAIAMLLRSGEHIAHAKKSCAKTTVMQGQAQTEKAAETCAIDVSDIIMAFSYAASSVSMAVTDCSLDVHVDHKCAGDIAGMLAGLSEVAAMGVSFQAKCPLTSQPSQFV